MSRALAFDNGGVEESCGFGIIRKVQVLTPSVKLTREFYIKRIAVALLVNDFGKDQTRGYRASRCIAITPADELAEARIVAEELKKSGVVDDRIFL